MYSHHSASVRSVVTFPNGAEPGSAAEEHDTPWNPNPMIAALSRRSDLDRFSVHLLHNLVLELSRLNLEVQELRNRNLQVTGRLEALARREKTLEGMVAYRDEGAKDGSA